MKQARIEWQGQVRDVLVDERDQVRLPGGRTLTNAFKPVMHRREIGKVDTLALMGILGDFRRSRSSLRSR